MADKQQTHTKESWARDGYAVVARRRNHKEVVARITSLPARRPTDSSAQSACDEENANGDRIVACVNACQGIPTEALEEGVIAAAADALRQMQKACDEWAAEFTQKKRAMNWGVVNDAYVATERVLSKLKGVK